MIGPFGLFVKNGSASLGGTIQLNLTDGPRSDGHFNLIAFGGCGFQSDIASIGDFIGPQSVCLNPHSDGMGGTACDNSNFMLATATLPLYVGTDSFQIPMNDPILESVTQAFSNKLVVSVSFSIDPIGFNFSFGDGTLPTLDLSGTGLTATLSATTDGAFTVGSDTTLLTPGFSTTDLETRLNAALGDGTVTNVTVNGAGDTFTITFAAGDKPSSLSLTGELPWAGFSPQLPSLFALLADPSVVVDGLDSVLQTIENVLQGQIFGVKLPLIGDAAGEQPGQPGDRRHPDEPAPAAREPAAPEQRSASTASSA